MLDAETLDALVVTSDNVESAEIAVQALGRGVPCLVEKAMAANVKDAERMIAAQAASGKLLVINWPLAWSPWIHTVKGLLEDGAIGPVFHMRYRNGHSGPREIGCDEWFVGWLYDEEKNGGGAIGDFCCYGSALARWYFGMPQSVYCAKGNYTKDYDVADDHAILVCKYPKASVVLEGTWATAAFDDGANPVLHGKHGTIGVYGNTVKVFRPGKEVETIESAPLAIGTPGDYFATLLASGGRPEGILDPAIAADGVRISEAGLRSDRSGCAERP